LKTDIASLKDELKTDIATLRTDMNSMRDELKTDNASLKDELKADNATLRTDMNSMRDEVKILGDKFNNIAWIGLFGIIAILSKEYVILFFSK